MSSVLIMALDEGGEIRFVGDVPRGAACSCFCPVCESPLVAKQGEAKEWHFSHEASQERPECEAGADNLARSLGIQYLKEQEARGELVLPEYKAAAGVNSVWLSTSVPVQWPVRLSGPLEWRDHPAKNHAVATGSLDTGATFALFVQVGDVGSPLLEGLPKDCAYGSLMVAPSWPPGTRTRADAMEAIKRSASFHWRYHPDTLGLLAAARAEVERQETAMRHRVEQMQRERAEEAGRRWADVNRRLVHNAHHGQQEGITAHSPSEDEQSNLVVAAGPGKDGTRYPQCPGHALGCNFQFFRLAADEAWLFYELDSAFVEAHLEMRSADQPRPKKVWAVAPVGGPFDGWDECLPRRVGLADEQHGIYWVLDHLPATLFLSPRSKETKMGRDPTGLL